MAFRIVQEKVRGKTDTSKCYCEILGVILSFTRLWQFLLLLWGFPMIKPPFDKTQSEFRMIQAYLYYTVQATTVYLYHQKSTMRTGRNSRNMGHMQ